MGILAIPADDDQKLLQVERPPVERRPQKVRPTAEKNQREGVADHFIELTPTAAKTVLLIDGYNVIK
jgi:hypothetical protein